MEAAGIVCEFDPLHKGHEVLLRAAKAETGLPVVCAMSGNYTQRGGTACLSKFARAEMAVRCGADLVAELPTPWAMATAEKFADGGVVLLAKCGVTKLYFGSECGDSAALLRASKALESPAFPPLLKAALAQGDNFAAARQRAVSALLTAEDAALLSSPNNTLGIEYCRALLQSGSEPEIFTVSRTGAAHDAAAGDAGGYSASAIRQLLGDGRRADALSRMVPAMQAAYAAEEAAGRAPVFASACERAILSRLRGMSPADFDALDTGREGIGQRLYNASREASSLSAILDAAKTRRYAYARLRRMVLWAYLGLTPADVPAHVPYLRVLAANETGRTLLHQMRKRAQLPVITKPAAVRQLSPEAQALFRLEARGADLYALAYPALSAAAGGTLWRQGPAML